MRNITKTMISLTLIAVVTACVGFVTAAPGERDGKKMDDRGFGPPPRELSQEEKQEIKNQINQLMKDAQNMISKGEYEPAFEVITELHRRLAELTGRPVQMPMEGPRQGRGQGPWQGDDMQGPMPPREGGGPFMPPPDGRGEFRGQRQPGPMDGNEPRMGKGMQDRQRMQDRDPEKLFNMLREQGEEGFEKAVKMFEKITAKMKEKKIEVDKKALQKYEEALKLRENKKLYAAFDSIHSAFMILHESMKDKGIFPGLGMKSDRQMGPKGKMDRGAAGKNLSDEERKKVETELKALKEVARKYVEKNGEDDFIIGCFKKFKDIERAVRRGEMKVAEGIEKVKALKKEIEKKLS